MHAQQASPPEGAAHQLVEDAVGAFAGVRTRQRQGRTQTAIGCARLPCPGAHVRTLMGACAVTGIPPPVQGVWWNTALACLYCQQQVQASACCIAPDPPRPAADGWMVHVTFCIHHPSNPSLYGKCCSLCVYVCVYVRACVQACAVDPGGVRTSIWDHVPWLKVSRPRVHI